VPAAGHRASPARGHDTEVVRDLAALRPVARAVAIGTFDGVHCGHRRVIAAALETGARLGVRTTILTFDRHPMAVVDPAGQPRLLTAAAEKTRLLSAAGADELVMLEFTSELAGMTPARFTGEVLAGALRARAVCVGANFSFGAGGSGTVADLTAAGQELGFEVVVVPLAESHGRPISSTRIRRLLARGELDEVRAILGRPPSTSGEVVGGWQRGRTLGVPTANLDVAAGTIFPGRGVYAGRACVDGRWYRTAVNVGHNPTFHDPAEETAIVRIEAHLLDFSGYLYGKQIRVDFLRKLRAEERFDSVEALVEQMRADIELTRRLEDQAFVEVGLLRT